jgi:hypothetical protein
MDLRNEHPMSFKKSAKSSLEKYENFQILNKISKVSFGGLGESACRRQMVRAQAMSSSCPPS